jgi:hypothetical protein
VGIRCCRWPGNPLKASALTCLLVLTLTACAASRPAAAPTVPAAVATPSPAPNFIRFSRPWGAHGRGLTLDATGHGSLHWRTYQWCKDDPRPPCDSIAPSGQIIYGGNAIVVLTTVEGSTAYGHISSSTDPRAWPVGPFQITVLPYDMVRLEPGAILLCGPDFAKLAPRELLGSSGC